MKTVIKILLLVFISYVTFGNDGVAAISAGGLIFSKSDDISMEREVLTVSTGEVRVEYLFRNHSPEAQTIIVAFPMPDIICDPFQNMKYPDNFKTSVNGREIQLKKEAKAIIYYDNGKLEVGKDITTFLHENGVPVDCRDIEETKDDSPDTVSIEYKKLMELGLACCDPHMDPYSIYYKTEIKYYWEQTFPANDTIRISHSYRPSLGEINGYYEHDPGRDRIKSYAENFRSFYVKNFQKDNTGADFTIEGKKYFHLDYILKTANTWKGPIKDFYLIIKSTGDLNVANLTGELKLFNGDLKLHKKDFIPEEDLTVFFFEKE